MEVLVRRVSGLEEVAAAHEYIVENKAVRKVVVVAP